MAESSSSSPFTPASFNDYNNSLQTVALTATKRGAQLPADISFHRTIDRAFGRELDACSARVLSLTNRLLALAASVHGSNAKSKGKARLESAEDVLDDFRALVVDPMDQLLERADICLDEVLGRTKPPAIAVNPTPTTMQKKKAKIPPKGRLDPALQHASHLPKPQLRFARKVDNSPHTIWQPTLQHKYHAQVPLGYNLNDAIDVDMDGEGDELSVPSALHPYRYEITHTPYPSHMFAPAEPIAPASFDVTPFTWVDTPAHFSAMLERLRDAREIAVDLEYHSYRTFGGFVCLMQLSTREADWVVDTLALRDDMEALNEVFTDPRIVKVLHGAESDIVWLQQDFNLYIVNLFDTHHASKVLDFPRHNLATLLEMYCDFIADKRYQLADWRIRPLPEEMLAYARSDTHFLLFIFDNLRNALLDRGQSLSSSQSCAETPSASTSLSGAPTTDPQALIREVLSRSETTALRVYAKEGYDAAGGTGPGGWDNLARKWNKGALMAAAELEGVKDSVYAVQRAVYRCVHTWRDRVARVEDESTRYVLANHYLFVLAEQPPADMAALLRTLRSVPPVVQRRAKELLGAIRTAVASALAPSTSGSPPAISGDAEFSSGISALENTAISTARVAEMPQSIADDDAAVPSPPMLILSVVIGCCGEGSRKVRPAATNKASIASASASSLFGATLAPTSGRDSVKEEVRVSYSATRSALFDERVTSISRTSETARGSRFQEVVARIHGTLVIAPTMPKLAAIPSKAGAEMVEAVEEAAGSAQIEGQAEIPFIPAAQRTSAKMETVDDTIVVVGQARAKKRKRAPPRTAAIEVESFDYSTASNILDEGFDGDAAEEAGTKKQKKKARQMKGAAGYQYGEFPAPPKALSQPKSGNQSRTFR
ncbi:uncharacterized protein LAESUDRAFT_733747 [Laetiporus sulphureus 93-53]|uniref:HRDC domain-containing protein n=1 Tax=Laetiporus sulphureus 93-53 TaxID=1314785 RepID=A0A165HI39_9APHY|nr:uncharacterized protein LAESUDRAFT_733747 [Laetiporus sulphureus 93-53]KZT11760.1 hypothetical protein LAESUDRAFT_733747 [Laetiporus sulphureus 93-53]